MHFLIVSWELHCNSAQERLASGGLWDAPIAQMSSAVNLSGPVSDTWRRNDREGAVPAPNEEGGHLLSLCVVGRIGGHVEVEPPETRGRAPVPQQGRVDMVHGRQQPDGRAPRQLSQQLLRLGALQACRKRLSSQNRTG